MTGVQTCALPILARPSTNGSPLTRIALKVVGFLQIPQLYISREYVAHVELCRCAGWNLPHEVILERQRVEVEAHEGFPYRHVFREVNK